MRYQHLSILASLLLLLGSPCAAEVFHNTLMPQGTVTVAALPTTYPGNAPRKYPPFIPAPNRSAPRSRTLQEAFAEDALSATDLPDTRSHHQPPPEWAFKGLPDSGTVIPPGSSGAVGHEQVVTALNDRLTIQTRNGMVLKTIAIDTFWSPLGTTSSYNPRVAYDAAAQRWILVALTSYESSQALLLIAVSQANDPMATWNLYTLSIDQEGQLWSDAPALGFNKQWIVIQANMFTTSDDAFSCSTICAISKAQLYCNQPAAYTLFSDATIGGSQIPAQTNDDCSETEYLLQDWQSDAGNRGLLRLYALTGPTNSPSLTPIAFPSCPEPWAPEPPLINKGFAPQKGTPLRIMNNDSRIQNVVYRNGSLWAVHTIFLPAQNPEYSAVQWWQISTSGVPQQRGRIEHPGATSKNGKFFYAFPSIAVNGTNDALIGFTRFGSETFPSAGFAYRLASDQHNDMRPPKIVQAGLARYTKDFGSGLIRWGDASATVVDPINDRDFWTLQEYAETPWNTTSRWGVQWGHVVLD